MSESTYLTEGTNILQTCIFININIFLFPSLWEQKAASELFNHPTYKAMPKHAYILGVESWALGITGPITPLKQNTRQIQLQL